MKMDPYLSFDGRCAEAFDFYASVLGGELTMRSTWAEAPGDMGVGPEQADQVMHSCLRIGDRAIFGADAPGTRYSKPQGFSVALTYPSAAEARAVFDALSEGGQVMMAFAPTFWAAGFGMFIDRFGTPWMVGTDEPPS